MRSFVLEPVDGDALPDFRPGQFLALKLKPPDAPAALLRSYSLAAPSAPASYRIAVKRETAGVGSAYLHDAVHVGDVIEVGAPRGDFTLDVDAAGPVALLSAGVGVTPVLAMLGALARAGSARPVWWLHGARNRCRARRSRPRHASCSPRSPRRGRACATAGPDPTTLPAATTTRSAASTSTRCATRACRAEADFYLCGPSAFLRDLTASLLSWGVAPERVHKEVFGPEPRDDAPDPHAPPGEPGTGPEIAFSRAALTVRWDDRYGSLLELAEACDVPADWSCRTGVCHRCESGLVDGDVDYEPAPLDEPAPGQLLLCCSRPRGPVTIDL